MTSTSSTPSTLILKTDRRGRVRTPPERREAILDEFERSGMSGAAFARHCGIKYPTFATWRWQRARREEQSAEQVALPAFAEVVVERRESPAGLRIELPAGASLVVREPGDARLAAAVLAALEAR